jgi:L-2-hydroxyglutarate oxidase LhgO
METPYDLVMVGAGIVGLATARELTRRRPGLRMAVVDKEPAVGRHQTSHNSGVLHAGVYYQPGSLKARLCVRGKSLLEEYAAERGIAVDTCGKVIVALAEDELGRLEDLHRRGTENGVPGLRMIDAAELREIEPHAAGIRALHSPHTGIVDFAAVADALAADLVADGVDLLLGREVTALEHRDGLQVVRTPYGDLRTRSVIGCAGLHSDRLAGLATRPEARIVPFRGDYYTLRPEARHLCQGLIYPVPDPALPFLGVHFTKRHDGEVWAGPNAVLALAREGYRRSDVRLADLRETLGYPGFRSLARRWWRTGAAEMWRDVAKPAFVRELRRYVPEVDGADLVFGPSGVRAQAVAPDGAMVDDFLLQEQQSALFVLNAPSPAATASLAIAEHLADRAEAALPLH